MPAINNEKIENNKKEDIKGDYFNNGMAAKLFRSSEAMTPYMDKNISFDIMY